MPLAAFQDDGGLADAGVHFRHWNALGTERVVGGVADDFVSSVYPRRGIRRSADDGLPRVQVFPGDVDVVDALHSVCSFQSCGEVICP